MVISVRGECYHVVSYHLSVHLAMDEFHHFSCTFIPSLQLHIHFINLFRAQTASTLTTPISTASVVQAQNTAVALCLRAPRLQRVEWCVVVYSECARRATRRAAAMGQLRLQLATRRSHNKTVVIVSPMERAATAPKPPTTYAR